MRLTTLSSTLLTHLERLLRRDFAMSIDNPGVIPEMDFRVEMCFPVTIASRMGQRGVQSAVFRARQTVREPGPPPRPHDRPPAARS